MKPKDLVLYHYWRSSCSWRVRWALALKEISYKHIAINLLAGDNQKEAYLKINKSGQVPALHIGNKFVSESLAIIEWLDEIHPSPKLILGTPSKRMAIRKLSYKIASGVQPIQNLSVMRAHSKEKAKQREWSKKWIVSGFKAYEKILEKTSTKFSFGSEITMADLCLIPQVYNAKRFSVNLEEFPKVRGVYENCLKTKSCQNSHPDRFKPEE